MLVSSIRISAISVCCRGLGSSWSCRILMTRLSAGGWRRQMHGARSSARLRCRVTERPGPIRFRRRFGARRRVTTRRSRLRSTSGRNSRSRSASPRPLPFLVRSLSLSARRRPLLACPCQTPRSAGASSAAQSSPTGLIVSTGGISRYPMRSPRELSRRTITASSASVSRRSRIQRPIWRASHASVSRSRPT